MPLAGRSLFRARSFSVVTVLTLALGLASSTVMFALVQGVPVLRNRSPRHLETASRDSFVDYYRCAPCGCT